MANTSQIPVTSVTPTAIIANSPCRNVRISENRGVSGWATVDFYIYKPSLVVTPVRIQAGAQYLFNSYSGNFQIGDIVGYVQMVSSRTTTFDQDEDRG